MNAWLARRDRPELLGVAIILAFLCLWSGLPLTVAVVVSPDAIDRGEIQLTPPCPARANGGPGCSTCGMTRGFCAMARLRVGDAHRYNPGAPWLFALALATFLATGAGLLRVAAEMRRRPTMGALQPAC
ncbi:MAG: DUF2752 domain-containing protein [Sandaracinaceae bacterium]